MEIHYCLLHSTVQRTVGGLKWLKLNNKNKSRHWIVPKLTIILLLFFLNNSSSHSTYFCWKNIFLSSTFPQEIYPLCNEIRWKYNACRLLGTTCMSFTKKKIPMTCYCIISCHCLFLNNAFLMSGFYMQNLSTFCTFSGARFLIVWSL